MIKGEGMQNKGFTLVELLIAATIIGMLAIFATTQYRSSAAETRWTQAKAKADQFAYAIERARLDYPGIEFSAESWSDKVVNNTCDLRPGKKNVDLGELVDCGYMENFGDSYFDYYSCDDQSIECSAGYTLVVQINQTANLPAEYKTYKYYASTTKSGQETKS